MMYTILDCLLLIDLMLSSDLTFFMYTLYNIIPSLILYVKMKYYNKIILMEI
jgi:hypothetical protein